MTLTPRDWYDVAFGASVFLIGLIDVIVRSGLASGPIAVVIVLAVAAGHYRLRPGLALGGIWLAGALILAGPMAVPLVALSAIVVAYGCARYGSTAVVAASAVSIPLALVGGAAALILGGRFNVPWVYELSPRIGAGVPLVVYVFGSVAALVLPWLVGLAMRMSDRAAETKVAHVAAEHTAQVEHSARLEAEELASVREAQARMARDVHDAVGHSLAVILAQAEAAKILADTDPAAYRRSAEAIAETARASLGDVRRVLEPTASGITTPPGDLQSLIDGVRTTGAAVAWEVSGSPRPMPDEHAAAAYRVLQEMLTNALKHGTPGAEIVARAVWEESALRVDVSNLAPSGDALASGRGLAGMRTRVAALGGRVTTSADGQWFTASLWLPLATPPHGAGEW